MKLRLHVVFRLNVCSCLRIIFLKTKLIEEEIVIFVCATTGQGDEPDNMKVSICPQSYTF